MKELLCIASIIVVVSCGFVLAEIDLDDPAEPWKTAKVGVTTDVPPTFQPLRRNGNTVECWNRLYELGELFPRKIRSVGKDILAAPIAMIIRSAKTASPLQGEGPEVILTRGDRIEWKGRGSAGGMGAKAGLRLAGAAAWPSGSLRAAAPSPKRSPEFAMEPRRRRPPRVPGLVLRARCPRLIRASASMPCPFV